MGTETASSPGPDTSTEASWIPWPRVVASTCNVTTVGVVIVDESTLIHAWLGVTVSGPDEPSVTRTFKSTSAAPPGARLIATGDGLTDMTGSLLTTRKSERMVVAGPLGGVNLAVTLWAPSTSR